MDSYFSLWRVPNDWKTRKAWEGIPQEKQQLAQVQLSGDELNIVHETDIEIFFNRLRAVFATKVSKVQYERLLLKTPQLPEEKTEDYIMRKSQEIFARLPLAEYPMVEHCSLIAEGIHNQRLKRTLLKAAMSDRINVNSLRKKAIEEESINDLMSKPRVAEVETPKKKGSRFIPRFLFKNKPVAGTTSKNQVRAVQADTRKTGQTAKKCWHCGDPDHIRPDCPKFWEDQQKQGRSYRQILEVLDDDELEACLQSQTIEEDEDEEAENSHPPVMASTGYRGNSEAGDA